MPDIVTDTPTVKRGRPSVKQCDPLNTQLNTEPVCLTCAEVMGRLAASPAAVYAHGSRFASFPDLGRGRRQGAAIRLTTFRLPWQNTAHS
jgi:hypothetical protein